MQHFTWLLHAWSYVNHFIIVIVYVIHSLQGVQIVQRLCTIQNPRDLVPLMAKGSDTLTWAFCTEWEGPSCLQKNNYQDSQELRLRVSWESKLSQFQLYKNKAFLYIGVGHQDQWSFATRPGKKTWSIMTQCNNMWPATYTCHYGRCAFVFVPALDFYAEMVSNYLSNQLFGLFKTLNKSQSII